MSGLLLQNPDGASFQARAILEMLRDRLQSGVKGSYDTGLNCYHAEPRFTRYENGRERGYIVFMGTGALGGKGDHQLNIAFYEGRNHDGICIRWCDKVTWNPPVYEDIPWADPDSSEPDKSFGYANIDSASCFIANKIIEFWEEHGYKPKAA